MGKALGNYFAAPYAFRKWQSLLASLWTTQGLAGSIH
jgi:hypothetical protein